MILSRRAAASISSSGPSRSPIIASSDALATPLWMLVNGRRPNALTARVTIGAAGAEVGISDGNETIRMSLWTAFLLMDSPTFILIIAPICRRWPRILREGGSGLRTWGHRVVEPGRHDVD